MTRSNAFWKVFEATGHIGAYLLYKDYSDAEQNYPATNPGEQQNVATGGEL